MILTKVIKIVMYCVPCALRKGLDSMMTKYRLTLAGKIAIFILVAALAAGALYFTGSFEKLTAAPSTDNSVASTEPGNTKEELDISLDEWIGWKSILDANGGITTQKGSIYDQLGLHLNIHIINDATQSSNALIKGSLDGAGYTVNRYAFLYEKFRNSSVPVSMTYITNSSSGGDGIIAKQGINSVEDLLTKKIAVPRFSEAQTLVEWLISKSSLTPEQVKQIRSNMVMFDTPDDAAKALFANQVDAAATWQPYLSQAASTMGYKVLFSTRSATNLVLDGIVFRQDYVNAHPDQIAKFIEGALRAESLYKTEFTAIKEVMPLFSTETDDSIRSMTEDATLSNYAANKQLFSGVAQTLFKDMSNIWSSIGEKADASYADEAFDSSILLSLQDKFKDAVAVKTQFTQEQRSTAKEQDNQEALLNQKLSINFETNSSAIRPESFLELNKFADTAKILNNVILQIEGNTDSAGSMEANKKLSLERAGSVAKYLQVAQGIDPSRFVLVGNGPAKPVADNGTEEGRAANRRTEVFFKVVEQN